MIDTLIKTEIKTPAIYRSRALNQRYTNVGENYILRITPTSVSFLRPENIHSEEVQEIEKSSIKCSLHGAIQVYDQAIKEITEMVEKLNPFRGISTPTIKIDHFSYGPKFGLTVTLKKSQFDIDLDVDDFMEYAYKNDYNLSEGPTREAMNSTLDPGHPDRQDTVEYRMEIEEMAENKELMTIALENYLTLKLS